MRSENVYRALEQGRSRFEICQVVSKSVKQLHRPGSRFQDTIDYTLLHMTGPAEAPEPTPAKPAASLAKAA
jgi:hypothetical protein